jgi:prefoldin subunit 5
MENEDQLKHRLEQLRHEYNECVQSIQALISRKDKIQQNMLDLHFEIMAIEGAKSIAEQEDKEFLSTIENFIFNNTNDETK